jgi:PKD repeat protein
MSGGVTGPPEPPIVPFDLFTYVCPGAIGTPICARWDGEECISWYCLDEGDSPISPIESVSGGISSGAAGATIPVPQAIAEFSWRLLANGRVDFKNESLNFLSNCFWTFGDGYTSTAFNPSHIYAAAGNYIVTLNTWEWNTGYIFLWRNPCIENIGLNQACIQNLTTGNCVTEPVTLPGVPLTPLVYKNNILLGSGTYIYTEATGLITNFNPVLEIGDEILITLIQTAYADKMAFATEEITVEILPEYVDFTYTVMGTSIYFENISTITGEIRWDFGDDKYSQEDSPFHQYAETGTYDIILWIDNRFTKKTINLATLFFASIGFWGGSYPGYSDNPWFIGLDFQNCTWLFDNCEIEFIIAGQTAPFYTIGPNGEENEWQIWAYPLNNFQSLKNTYVSFSVNITYEGNTYTISDNIYLAWWGFAITLEFGSEVEIERLIAQFSADIYEGITPLTVQFTDESLGNPTAWLWQFGDGEESTEQHIEHTFTEPGIYQVRLTVFNYLYNDHCEHIIYAYEDIPIESILYCIKVGLYYYAIIGNQICIYDLDWVLQSCFGTFTEAVYLVAFGSCILVVDRGANNIQIFDLNGVWQSTYGEYGEGPGQFDSPFGITTDGVYIYIADSGNQRIEKFSFDEATCSIIEYIDEWAVDYVPYGLASDGDFIYVADTVGKNIYIYTSTGELVMIYYHGYDNVYYIWIEGDILYLQYNGNIAILRLNVKFIKKIKDRYIIRSYCGAYQVFYNNYFGPGEDEDPSIFTLINSLHAEQFISFTVTVNIINDEEWGLFVPVTINILRPFRIFNIAGNVIPDMEAEQHKKVQRPTYRIEIE